MTKDDDNSEAKFREKYAARIKEQTLETLPAFLAELTDQPHDYGTICLAIAFGAVATAWAIERSPHGGITGFQAGAVGWELLRGWGSPGLGEIGTRLLNYDDLLYPQYAYKFNTISADTWAAAQKAAAAKLGEIGGSAHPAVLDHLQSVANGNLPFGLKIEAA